MAFKPPRRCFKPVNISCTISTPGATYLEYLGLDLYEFLVVPKFRYFTFQKSVFFCPLTAQSNPTSS